MNYPVWDVSVLGGTWIIGFISIVHIFVSHFAVGGGLFFAITEWLAWKNNDDKLYAYLKKHSLFFLLLTSVFGAVTGVGIWWSISLVSPNGTASLIQTYTLGWACEYLFFVAELATIFAYYYTWDRISKEQHIRLAQLYAFMSIMTLVIINGILTYMLTPGGWIKSHYWLQGFFNETYWPSLIMRIVIMITIAGMYALFTGSFIKSDLEFRSRLLKYAAKWFIPLFVVGPLVAVWYFLNLPKTSLETVFAGIQTSGVGNFSIMARVLYLSLILSGTILLFAFVGPYLNPKGFTPRFAALFMICGLLVTGMGEWSREMLRKPFVIYNYMYSNGIRTDQIAEINKTGFLPATKWATGKETGVELGEKMFRFQCLSCHTKNGYRSMEKMLAGRDEKAIGNFLKALHETDPAKNPYLKIMPPVAGKPEEIDALAQYLATLTVKDSKALAQSKPE